MKTWAITGVVTNPFLYAAQVKYLEEWGCRSHIPRRLLKILKNPTVEI